MVIKPTEMLPLAAILTANALSFIFKTEIQKMGPIVGFLIQIGMIIGIIGVLVGRNWSITVDGSKCHFLKMQVFPPGIEVDIPVEKSWRRNAQKNPLLPHLLTTSFDTRVPVKIDEKGKLIHRIHLTHLGTLTSRLESGHGTVTYKGEDIESDNIFHMTIWENTICPVSQEKSQEEPNYILINASKADQSNDIMKNQILEVALGLNDLTPQQLKMQPPTVRQYIHKIKSQNNRYRDTVVKSTGYISALASNLGHYRSLSLNLEGKNEIANQELSGIIEYPMNVETASVRRNQSTRTNIDDVMRSSNQKNWLNRFDIKWIIIGIIGFASLIYLWANPKALQNVTQSLTASNILIGAILIGVIGFLVYQFKDKLKGTK